jgi:hypothetical protein
MAQTRYYSSSAKKTILQSPIVAGDVTLLVLEAADFPSNYPFTLILDRDTLDEEVVEATASTSTSFTVTRGVDGTTAVAHSSGSTVEHGTSARDFRESDQHRSTSENVHGIGLGSLVVGTTDVQTLTNKTLGSDLAAGGFKITGVADPVSAQDAATKNWSETSMTAQVNQATTQATNSASSAAASLVSANASQVSRLASEAAKTAAETAETNAEAAEANVAASAATATAQAGISTTQAGISTTQAGISTTQAGISTTQAGISSTKAGESDTSAIASAASAVQSANSAAAAVAAFDQFDDRFLGSKSSAPSTDNDGDPLVTGALYYNTVEGKMYVWDGSGWLPASAASVISITSFEFTATAGQTAFTGTDANGVTLAFSVGLIQVFLNGVLLSPGDDYTPTAGTVTLVSGAAVSDVLVVVAFASFQVADVYTQAQSDGRYYTKAQSDAAFTTPAQLSSVEALALLGL